MGCTEIATIGLASSLAFNAALDNFGEDLGSIRKIRAKDFMSIKSIFLTLDPYIFKNAVDVGIPKTDGGRGIKLAAILGMFGDSKRILQIFDSVSKERLKMARDLERSLDIQIKIKREKSDIYAEVRIKMEKDVWGRAIIQNAHDKIVLVESNKRCFLKGRVSRKKDTEEHKKAFKDLTIDDLIDFVADLPGEIKTVVRNGVDLVKNLSKEGLKRPLGIGVGYNLRKSGGEKTSMKTRTASAIDARMFGSPNPSIAVAGSGNQGITATMPIYAYADETKMNEDLLVRSTALSYLVTIYATCHSSYLSAVCGLGSKAGIGSSAGLAYYMSGGDGRVVKMAIQNFIASIPGMICDGGKYSCSIKGAIVSDSVYQSAMLALNSTELPYASGILGKNAEESIRNLGEIFKAVKPLNERILKIIASKQE